MVKIGIIDYGIGNIKSIENAVIKLGASPILSGSREELLSCDRVILPGVGAFQNGINNLKERGLDIVINEYVQTEKPLLGICLGMQMLFDESEEFGTTKGLGLIGGRVTKIATSKRLPHIGWASIQAGDTPWKGTILDDTPEKSKVYFVHTFSAKPQDKSHLLASAKYGDVEVCAAVKNKNIYGTQFHPEKSSHIGLSILKKFINS